MKRTIAVLLAAVLLLFAAGCGKQTTAPSAPTEAPVSAPADSQESKVLEVFVSGLHGSARILRGDGTAEALTQDSLLGAGDSIITDRSSTVDLQVNDLSALITVSPSSEILFDTASSESEGRELVIVVRKGSISNSVDTKLEAGDIYEVCTGDMTMAIRGTDALVDCRDGRTSISLLTGKALVYSCYDEQVYVVPAGIIGHFVPDDEPEFELIDLGSYAEISAAAESLLENAKADDKDFADAEGYETELRDTYISDDDYSFHVTKYLVKDINAPEPTTSVPAEETTFETSLSTTAKQTTIRTTARKTTVAPTAATTIPTAPTEPTEPTVPSSSTEPTPSESTDPTEATSATAAVNYFYSISGLYRNEDGKAVSLGGGHQTSDYLYLPAVISSSGTADNGQTFYFSVSVNESNVAYYSEARRIPAQSVTEGEYDAGSVYAMLTIVSF